MKFIVYSRPDGGVSIVRPAAQFIETFNTEAEGMAAVQAKDVPSDATNVEIMEASALPVSREYRDAWTKLGAGAPTIDMPKARDIHAERIAVEIAAKIALFKIKERTQRLKGNIAQADQHAADTTALEALDLNALATQIAAAPNPTVLSAIRPALLSI